MTETTFDEEYEEGLLAVIVFVSDDGTVTIIPTNIGEEL